MQRSAHPARLRAWEFASRSASGVAAVLRDFHNQARHAYPVDFPPPSERDRPSHWPCPACRYVRRTRHPTNCRAPI
eukprot:12929056-Prorocentrum_lima.AAC.1